jgi:hypothetical protein
MFTVDSKRLSPTLTKSIIVDVETSDIKLFYFNFYKNIQEPSINSVIWVVIL